MNESKTYEQTEELMETRVTIKIVTNQLLNSAANKLRQSFLNLKEIDKRLSRFNPESELNRLNKKSRGNFVEVSPLLYFPVKFSLRLAEKTDGAFDPTIADYLEAYGFDQILSLQKNEQLLQVLKNKRNDYRQIKLYDDITAVKLTPMMKLDLGGIAKGYSLDLIAKYLNEFENVFINAGGDVFARGVNPNGKPWKIGLRDPFKEEGYFEVLELNNGAAATSGAYFKKSDKIGPLINPRTGEIVSELACATVLADSCVKADSYATAVMVLGPKYGAEFLQRENLKGILVKDNGEMIRIGM